MLSSCCKVSALTSMLAFSPVIIHRFKYVKVLVFQGATGAEKHLGGKCKKITNFSQPVLVDIISNLNAFTFNHESVSFYIFPHADVFACSFHKIHVRNGQKVESYTMSDL